MKRVKKVFICLVILVGLSACGDTTEFNEMVVETEVTSDPGGGDGNEGSGGGGTPPPGE